jgi:DNA-binding MarR family transcriptional regulator
MSDIRWLDPHQLRTWRAYMQMQGRLSARLNRQLQIDSGLSLADYEVLANLTDVTDGRLRAYELQQRLQWEQSRLSHHLTRMQRRGLVGREGCTDDGRGAFVVLTEEGRAAIEAAAPGHVDTVRRLFFDGLDPDQVALVEQLCRRVLDRLTEAPDQEPTGS